MQLGYKKLRTMADAVAIKPNLFREMVYVIPTCLIENAFSAFAAIVKNCSNKNKFRLQINTFINIH